MSLESLKDYLIVLNFIRKKAELSNRFNFVCLGHEDNVGKEFNDLGYNDFYQIFWSLIHDEIFESSSGDNGNMFLNIDKEKFYSLCSDVENRISLLSGGNIDKIMVLDFDSQSSILTINNHKIEIRKQKNDNYAHSLLKYIFENGTDQQFFYSELLEDILGVSSVGKEAWRTMYRACEDIQKKVQKGSNYKINDFLDYSSGIKGSVRIRVKYLVS